MDNFKIDITAEGRDSLRKAIEIAFTHNAPGRAAKSFHVTELKSTEYNGVPANLDGRTAIILRWTNAEKLVEGGPVNLPFKLDIPGAADFVSRWLDEQELDDEPDHDGHNGNGWRIFTTGGWGHVGEDNYAICAIVPAWAMYGK